LWEISYLSRRNRLVLNKPLDEWLDLSLQLSFATVLPVDGSVAREAARLPDIHRDPADRLILATARLHDLDVISADRRLSDYPGVRDIW
jgi:PIN domain nuclease of toxin-antitoxin system